MKVLKFGSSTLTSTRKILGVKRIIEREKVPCVVVVSAFKGVADSLRITGSLAALRDQKYVSLLNEINTCHIKLAGDLLTGIKADTVLFKISELSEELNEILKGVFLVREMSDYSLNKILSFGERFASAIYSGIVEKALVLDLNSLSGENTALPYSGNTHSFIFGLAKKMINSARKRVIVPGFIPDASDLQYKKTGLSGSDYIAASIAAAINADTLEIWTEEKGFMTADPKNVRKAYPIEYLTYQEAIELSHFGAQVINTPTLRPVYRKLIPVLIKNLSYPEEKGTLISDRTSNGSRSLIKGISSIGHIDLITLQGTAMVGVTGTSMRLFGALAKNNINIILITQASSEYSITFAINPPDTKLAFNAINQEFRQEISVNRELKALVEKELSIIAIVGERMKNTPGISATLFRSLGMNGINVIATAQGSSELNISVVIKRKNLKKALNVIHDGFFLSRYKEMHIFIAGTGIVGASLMDQLQKQHDTLIKEHNLKINLTGVINSRKMLLDIKSIPLDSYAEKLNSSTVKGDIELFISKMRKLNLRNSVFIDCTANHKVASMYKLILGDYISVVTANKIACSSEYSYYQQLKSTANEKGVRFMYETTVCAGLPVIKTLNDLIVSGDRIKKIEAVLSGTLNFIFNTLSPEIPLSTAIRMARDKGISEPDPRIDLSGTDVVRKILILSREAGYEIEQNDVEVKRFLPDDCFEGDIDSFFRKVKDHDITFENERKQNAEMNRKWRFYASMENGKAKVELLTIDSGHPTFNLEGSNNIVLITTERYCELPLVIKGYGAGADVTAAGVFSDLMRVANV